MIFGSALVPCVIEGGKGADRIEVDSNPLFPRTATLSFTGSASAVRVYQDVRATGYGTAGDAKDYAYTGLFARVLGSTGDDWITDTSINGDVEGVQSQKFDGPAGNDRLFLGTGDDTGLGGADNDMIMGEFGNDRLMGGEGDDILTAGRGRDVVKGGLGADHFAFNQIDMGDAAFAGSPVGDRLADFNSAESDKIDLSLIDARGGQSGQQAFTFRGTDAFTGQQGEVRYEMSAKGVTVFLWDGTLRGNEATGHFDPVYLTFFVQGVASLTEQDFIL